MSDFEENKKILGQGAIIGAIGTFILAGFLNFQISDRYRHIKDTYNAALKRYYLPEGGALDSLIPKPHPTIVQGSAP